MAIVFFLNRLHPGIAPAAYEQWVRDVDYPTARSLATIRSYVVNRIEATLDGQASPFDYIERVEITDLAAYQDELSNAPGMGDFATQWSYYVAESIAVHGSEIV